ncbi:unnamed protein product [Urochloa decumbens]|uniref:WRKY domain-containing protein n=1 Tax=Urochloa decumbens TaxID=240449 RepID=A0ABC8W531_9POAL
MAMASAPACAASELVAKGRKSAAFLQAMLGQQPASGAGATPHGLQDLADEILRCCDRALAALHGAMEEAAHAAAGSARKRKPEHGPVAIPPATSSKRIRLSGGERATRRVEKKWTMEDGFIWRKYGQKDIHGSKYPRLYFRCTYKEDHGCMARRQVQQSEADPSVYLINYFGEHTCCRDDDVFAAESPAPFVINFGASTRDEYPSSSPCWPSCNEDDGGLVASETSDLCHSPEEKELPAGMGNEAELIVESTPVPELTSMSSPEWDPLDGCLVWDIGFGECLFDDIIGEFTPLDYVGLFQ